MPRVPLALIRRLASPRSGATHVPAGDRPAVYGQNGRLLGMPGGITVQAAAPADPPPDSATIRPRSVARLTARRTRTSSNGGSRTLRNMKSVASRGATPTLPRGRGGGPRAARPLSRVAGEQPGEAVRGHEAPAILHHRDVRAAPRDRGQPGREP